MPSDLARAVLALEDGLISRDQFVIACSALAFDPAESFSTFLRAQGWVAAENIDKLEERLKLDRRLDANRGVATYEYVSMGDSADSTVDDHARPRTPGPASPELHRDQFALPMQGGMAQRYKLAGLHARGGMGQVWLARDQLMRREVAFKDMRPERSGDARLAARFLREAFVTGQLEHPGIVPVYEVATKPDGHEPFCTMRFIRGRTLLQEIREFHAAGVPDMSGLRFREMLTAFVAVCNAVAFAHSRGVLHRDLKPANIVLGDFGEVMVLDWGLAKATRADGTTDDSEPYVSLESAAAETEAGQVLGTPAYMSPEQADGQTERQDERSDVYGLGAILYELLCGRPPFGGPNTPAILEQVRRVAPARPGAARPGVPRTLEVVCLKALSKSPAERYPSAKALADDMRHWLADEPVSAWVEPFAVRTRRWMRRHRTLVTAGAATSLAVVIAMAIGLVVVTGLNGQLDGANSALSTANGNLESANRALTTTNVALDNSRTQSENRRVDAERARDQAERVTTYLVSAFRKPDPEVDGGKLTLAEFLGQVEKQLDLDRGIDAPTRCWLLTALGQTHLGLGLLTDSRRVLDKAVVATKEIGEGDPNAIEAAVYAAGAANLQNRTDETVAALQSAVARCEAYLDKGHRTSLIAKYFLSNAWREAGNLDQAQRLAESLLALCREQLGDNDPLTFSAMNALASAHHANGRREVAMELFADVVRGRKALLGADNPDTLAAMNNLAYMYQTAGKLAQAADLMSEVLLQRKQRLGADHPTTLGFMHNLAGIYRDAGQIKQALAIQTDVFEAHKTKFGADHPSTLKAMNNLAGLHRDIGAMLRR